MSTALIVIDVQEEYFSGRLPIEFPPAPLALMGVEMASTAQWVQGLVSESGSSIR